MAMGTCCCVYLLILSMVEELNEKKKTPKLARTIFGIIMICIYVGMGGLVLAGYFSWMHEWLRWAGGVMFIVYGIWRAYRQFKGIDSRF